MNNTKIVAIGIVIILIAVVGFVALNTNDKTENGYNPDIPDSEYYPITIETINPTTNEMVDMTFTKRPTSVVVNEGGTLEMMALLGLEDLISEAFVKDSYMVEGNYVLTNLDLAEQLEDVVIKTRTERTLEHVMTLEPDFVIGWTSGFRDTAAGTFKFWEDRNVPTYVTNSPAKNLEENLKHYENVGKIFNIQDKAQEYIDTFDKSVKDIEKKTEEREDSEKPKVLALEINPDDTLLIYGTSYITGELIELAGGISTFDGGGVVPTSYEAVVNMNPEMIVLIINNGDFRDEATVNAQLNKLYSFEAFASVTAVADENVVTYGLYEVYGAGCLPPDILDRLYADFYL